MYVCINRLKAGEEMKRNEIIELVLLVFSLVGEKCWIGYRRPNTSISFYIMSLNHQSVTK